MLNSLFILAAGFPECPLFGCQELPTTPRSVMAAPITDGEYGDTPETAAIEFFNRNGFEVMFLESRGRQGGGSHYGSISFRVNYRGTLRRVFGKIVQTNSQSNAYENLRLQDRRGNLIDTYLTENGGNKPIIDRLEKSLAIMIENHICSTFARIKVRKDPGDERPMDFYIDFMPHLPEGKSAYDLVGALMVSNLPEDQRDLSHIMFQIGLTGGLLDRLGTRNHDCKLGNHLVAKGNSLSADDPCVMVDREGNVLAKRGCAFAFDTANHVEANEHTTNPDKRDSFEPKGYMIRGIDELANCLKGSGDFLDTIEKDQGDLSLALQKMSELSLNQVDKERIINQQAARAKAEFLHGFSQAVVPAALVRPVPVAAPVPATPARNLVPPTPRRTGRKRADS